MYFLTSMSLLGVGWCILCTFCAYYMPTQKHRVVVDSEKRQLPLWMDEIAKVFTYKKRG